LTGLGVSDQELKAAWFGHPIQLRHAIVQRVIADAARFHMGQQRAKEAARKPVPEVQRPGVSMPRSSYGDRELTVLRDQLGRSGSLRDAAKFRSAQIAQRRANGG
jgi:hypothetical protein